MVSWGKVISIFERNFFVILDPVTGAIKRVLYALCRVRISFWGREESLSGRTAGGQFFLSRKKLHQDIQDHLENPYQQVYDSHIIPPSR
jgi:hypothetical protein